MIRKGIAALLTLGSVAILLVGLFTWTEPLPTAHQRAYPPMPVLHVMGVGYTKQLTQSAYGFAQVFFWYGVTSEVDAQIGSRQSSDYVVFAVDSFRARRTAYIEIGETRIYGVHATLPGLLTKSLKWTCIESTMLQVPLWTLLVMLATYPVFAFIRGPLLRRLRRRRNQCADCGYSLIGLPGLRCPECGGVFNNPAKIAPPG